MRSKNEWKTIVSISFWVRGKSHISSFVSKDVYVGLLYNRHTSTQKSQKQKICSNSKMINLGFDCTGSVINKCSSSWI